jgi:type I restriction enzyme S subunit
MQCIKLKEILSKNTDKVTMEESKVYTQVTVRLWGKGVCRRDTIRGSEIKSGNRFIVKENQFILSKIDARHGAYGLVPKELNGAIITSDFPSYNLDITKILPQYFQWIFSQKKFIELCKNASSGTTNRIRLNESRFLDLEISLPSIAEQELTIKHLNKDADVIRRIKEYDLINQEFIQKIKQAILQEAFCGKLVSQEPEDEPASILLRKIKGERKKFVQKMNNKSSILFSPIIEEKKPYKLPNGWEWVRLGEIALVNMGQSPEGETYNNSGRGTPLINGPVEFSDGSFGCTIMSKWTTSPTKLCRKGDILICVRGSTTGRTNIAGFNACIGRGVASIEPYILQKYVHYYILFSEETIFNLGSGTTFPNITLDELNELIFPLPPIAEQKRIIEKIGQQLELCDELEEKIKENQITCEYLIEATLKEAFSS